MTADPVALPPHLLPIADAVVERTGIDVRRHPSTAVVAALETLREEQPGLSERGSAAVDRELPGWLIERIRVGETHFFRERRQLEFLRRTVIPEIASRRPPGHRLQLWSAGCSTGEEAYSLAIVLERAGLTDRSDLVATDMSEEALDRARDGRYREWGLRGLTADERERYFVSDGDQLRIQERFRQSVAFRRLNFVTDPYPPPRGDGFDLILCRNVLIYLTFEHIERVVRRLAGHLADGGWLITASSDPYLGDTAEFQTVRADRLVAYRRTRRPGVAEGVETPRPGRPPTRRRPRPPTDPPRSSNERGGRIPERPAVVPKRRAADEATPVQRIRSLADDGHIDAALAVARRSIEVRPMDAEIHHLLATLLADAGRWDDAVRAATAATYLDPGLAVGQIILGRAEMARGNHAAAARAFRNARRALSAMEADEPVPLAGGAVAGHLLSELRQLDGVLSGEAP